MSCSSFFEFNLNKTILSPSDLKDSLKKGRESLSKYYDTYKNTWNRSLLTEYSVKGVHLDVGDFELLLKGQLDKIEFIDERSVNVVDYKTGKKKSTNKENYQRQLTFYKLLLNLDEKGKYVMRSGELDYIEFENAKKPAKERFEVTDEAVNELIDLVKEKAKEIYNLNFWNKNCDEKECEYCALGKVVNGKSYQ